MKIGLDGWMDGWMDGEAEMDFRQELPRWGTRTIFATERSHLVPISGNDVAPWSKF